MRLFRLPRIEDPSTSDNGLAVWFELMNEEGETASCLVIAETVDAGRVLAEEQANRLLGGDWAMNEWSAG